MQPVPEQRTIMNSVYVQVTTALPFVPKLMVFHVIVVLCISGWAMLSHKHISKKFTAYPM